MWVIGKAEIYGKVGVMGGRLSEVGRWVEKWEKGLCGGGGNGGKRLRSEN